MSNARIQSVDGPDDAPSVIVPEQHGTEFARKRGVGQRVDGLRKAFTTKYVGHCFPSFASLKVSDSWVERSWWLGLTAAGGVRVGDARMIG